MRFNHCRLNFSLEFAFKKEKENHTFQLHSSRRGSRWDGFLFIFIYFKMGNVTVNHVRVMHRSGDPVPPGDRRDLEVDDDEEGSYF